VLVVDGLPSSVHVSPGQQSLRTVVEKQTSLLVAQLPWQVKDMMKSSVNGGRGRHFSEGSQQVVTKGGSTSGRKQGVSVAAQSSLCTWHVNLLVLDGSVRHLLVGSQQPMGTVVGE